MKKYVSALAEGLEVFGAQGNVRVLARSLFAALDGLVLQFLAGVEQEEIAAALEEVQQVLVLRRDGDGRPPGQQS